VSRPEALDHLDDCLGRLPEKQRIAVSLRFLSGKTPEDIATVLGTSRNNAYQLVSRGQAALRMLLEQRGVSVGSAALISLLAAEGQAATATAAPALISSVITSTTTTPTASVAALVQGAQTSMAITAAVPFATAAGLVLTAGSLTMALAVAPPAAKPAASIAKPAWATEMGTDASGTWAKLKVEGQTQILRLIPAGRFDMGADGGYSEPDEKPIRKVEISKPFWLADSEVTQALWQVVMTTNPSRFATQSNLPVEQVAWTDCQEFLEKLNGKVTGLGATLPTEAQWEYACRAGSTGDYAGDTAAMAWTKQNSGTQLHPVKGKQPNAWGLYDMYGNVLEWCSDWYGFGTYTTGAPLDPTGPATGTHRVIRGGGWFGGPTRSADRLGMPPDTKDGQIGFRIAIPTAR
jgi:formylglycine-generating enzyme required for sulfatase activity